MMETESQGIRDRAMPISETVISIIAEVTRYPRSILRPEAELEEELGIESVKRAEILGVLSNRLGFTPPKPDPENPEAMPKLRTISDVVAAVERLMGGQRAPVEKPVAAVPPPVVPLKPPAPAPVHVAPTLTTVAPDPTFQRAAEPAARPQSRESLEELIIGTIAEVTRYPRSILRMDADLEEELGIESVKRAEILGVLSNRLGLAAPEKGSENQMGKLRTIADVVNAVETLLAKPALSVVPDERESPNLQVVPARHALPASAVPPVTPSIPAPTPISTHQRTTRLVGRAHAPAAQPFLGKVVLVTGSGHGLGKALAMHLGKLGASVVVNSFHSREQGDRTAAELVAEGRDAIHAWGSVAHPEQLSGIFSTIDEKYGHLDFLVHAASNAKRGPLSEITPADWERAFKTEVVALHQAALKAAPLMDRRGGGKIVAITHPGTQRVFPDFACAGSVKAAVESLARYLAIELGPRGIQVNTLAPGPIPSGPSNDETDERRMAAWQARVPGLRLADISSVAGALAFLLSGEAAMMNGANMVVDGGLSIVL